MHKFMLIPAGLFVLCLILLVTLSLDPAAPPQMQEPVLSETVETPALPADTVPPTQEETVPTEAYTIPTTPPDRKPEPQRTAFPLRPSDPLYFETLLAPVTEKDPHNNELQDYVPGQVEIDGSHVTITAVREEDQYLSGRVESLLAFRYGSMTFRINCIDNPGVFPAVWMLPASGGLLPEVDIYEHIGRQPQYFYGVNHYEISDGYSSYHTNENFMHTSYYGLPEDYVIGFEWTEDSLSWTLNGEPLYTMTEHIPDVPMYLILNQAVGGIWCGIPTVASTFPSVMEVEFLDFRPQELYTR